MIDQTIPHSADAEHGVIGAVLVSHKAIDEVTSLKPEHFYVGAHREIFRVMMDMASAGKQIDVITLSESIYDRGLSDVTGGLSYLAEIANNVPSAANVKRYAEIVQSKSIERQLLSAVEEIRATVLAVGTTKDKLNKAQSLVMAVSESRQQKAPRLLADGLHDYVSSLEKRFSGECRGISTGFIDLDKNLSGGLQDGQLVIVAGRPAMGKSAFTNCIAINAAKNGYTTAIFSMEMTEVDQYDRVVATLGRVSLKDILDARLDGESGDKISAAISQMRDLPILIDDESGASVHSLMSKARQVKRSKGLSLMIVDALGLMEYDQNKAVSELGQITKTLKTFAKEMSIPVILLCQLSRKCEERIDKRPVLSDLRDSGNIEQDADVVIMLYRDEYYKPDTPDAGVAEVLIRKNRQGKTGTVPLAFIGDQTRFENLGRDWRPQDQDSGSRGNTRSRSRFSKDD